MAIYSSDNKWVHPECLKRFALLALEDVVIAERLITHGTKISIDASNGDVGFAL